MKLCNDTILQQRAALEAKGYALPTFDRAAVTAKSAAQNCLEECFRQKLAHNVPVCRPHSLFQTYFMRTTTHCGKCPGPNTKAAQKK